MINKSKQPDDKIITLTSFDEIMTTFSKRVKEERKKKGISQERLAEDVGVSDDTIKRIESGKGVKLDIAYNIAEVLHIPIESLLPRQDLLLSEDEIIEKIRAAQDTLQLLLEQYKEKLIKK